MVKGVTRRVILVDSPDRQRFEKAIFILKDGDSESAEDLRADIRAFNRTLVPRGMCLLVLNNL